MRQKIGAGVLPNTEKDAVLLARTQQGDEDAFTALHTKYLRPVAWMARSSLNSTQWSEDAAQSTFIVLWKRSRTIVLVGDSLLPWLLGVCRLECRKIASRERAKQHLPLEHVADPTNGEASVEEQIVRRNLIDQVNAHVAALGDTDRLIYRLCLVNELTYEAAARELGISHGALRNRLSRLKRDLRHMLRSQEAEETS